MNAIASSAACAKPCAVTSRSFLRVATLSSIRAVRCSRSILRNLRPRLCVSFSRQKPKPPEDFRQLRRFPASNLLRPSLHYDATAARHSRFLPTLALSGHPRHQSRWLPLSAHLLGICADRHCHAWPGARSCTRALQVAALPSVRAGRPGPGAAPSHSATIPARTVTIENEAV